MPFSRIGVITSLFEYDELPTALFMGMNSFNDRQEIDTVWLNNHHWSEIQVGNDVCDE